MLLLEPLLRESPFFVFLVAVVISGLYGGLGPGLLATGLGALAGSYFLLQSDASPAVQQLSTYLRIVQFVIAAALINWGVHAQRRVALHAVETARIREEALTSEQAARRLAEAAEKRFHDLVQGLEAIVWEADTSPFRFTFVNQPAERILGYPVQEWLTRPDFWKRVLHPEDREWVVTYCREATQAGRDHQLEYRTLASNGRVLWLRHLVRVARSEDGKAIQLRGVLLDITEQKRTQEALDVLRAAVEASMDGVAILDVDERYVYVNHAHAALYGYESPEALLGRSWRELYQEEERLRFEREITPIVQREGRWRGEATGQRRDGSHFPQEVSLTAFAAGGLICVVRDITVRKRAEAALTFLAEASKELASTLEYEVTLERVARLAVPLLADYCTVDLVEEDGSLRRLAVAHADPGKALLARELRRFPPDRGQATGVTEVLRTGKPVYAPELRDVIFAEAAQGDEHLRLLQELRPQSAMIIPLLARGRILGALSFLYAESGRRYVPADLLLAEEIAGRAALAIDNARLYRHQREIAHTLQQSLLPPELPRIPGMTLAACFRAAGEGIEVGGDFYDLFETSDHTWAVVIGDVNGKGPKAAAVTALARHTIQAVTLHISSPGEILAALNEALLRQCTGERFITVAYLRLELIPHGARLTLASGGHLPPLVMRRNGHVEMLATTGMLLGVLPDLEATEEILELGPGDAVVLYTDGVTEARTDHELFGEERLAALLGTCAGMDASAIAKRLDRAVMDFQEGNLRDDIAILVLQVNAA